MAADEKDMKTHSMCRLCTLYVNSNQGVKTTSLVLDTTTFQPGYNDQSKDAVDGFHQHSQSFNRSLPLSGLTFHSVTLGSFYLYAVSVDDRIIFPYAHI